MMRAAWLAAGALVIAIAIQLSVLNGLRLPGGGTPDLVLVLAAALAVAEGPVAGMLFGFGAGLCLDIAPPGSPVIGLYALVFCLAGWAAGRLSPVAGHSDRSSSGLVSVGLLAVVVAAAEALTAALGLALAPAAVTLAQVRFVLPSTIGYDLILCPFVLCLVVVGSSLAADRTGATRRFQGVVVLGWNASRGWQQAGPVAGSADASRRGKRRRRPPDLRLRSGAARPGDGWVKANRLEPHTHRQSARARRATRLRPAHGVAGSASGLLHPRSRPAAPVQLRFGGRRRDGVVGAAAMGAAAGWPGAHRHPGMLAGRAVPFRPHAGAPAGSAAHQPRLAGRSPAGSPGPAQIAFGGHRGDGTIGRSRLAGRTGPALWSAGPVRIAFGGHRGDGAVGHALARTGPKRRALRPARIRFARYRGDGTVGHALAAGRVRPAAARRRRPAIRFSGRRGDATLGYTLSSRWPDADSAAAPVPQPEPGSGRLVLAATRPASGPRLRFGSGPVQASRRPAAVPKFHRKSGVLRSPQRPDVVVAGGALGDSALRARARRPAPRLRLSGGAPGMLGGSGRGPRLGRPPGRAGKRPRFGYGRHSPLSLLAAGRLGRRPGGRWLARQRAGRRSGVWLISRRTGRTR